MIAVAMLVPLVLPAPSSFAQVPSPAPGRNPEEIQRLARQLGYSTEQIRTAGQSTDSFDALLRQSPLATAPFDSSALAPTNAKIETRDSTQPAPTRADDAQPFGYDVFRYSPTTFEPLAYGPVDPEYPVGPGDELVITLWGDAQMALTAVVNREGTLTLPDVGTIPVNGLTLDGVRSRIRAALAPVYAGLRPAGQRATISLDVSLGKLRSIQVFLLGEVVKPGGYTVSSVSRALNALYVAGGPTRAGSLRDLRVIRGGQVVAHVDLYRLLLTGDADDETRLQNGDVLFVPPVGRRVKVSGPLRRNGYFELKPGEELAALLQMAGGPLADADLVRGQIDRVVPPAQRDSLRGQDRVAVDVSLARALSSPGGDVPLYDADELVTHAIGEERQNTVAISGQSVMKPGVYEYRPGLRVSGLVALADGLKPEAFLGRAQVTRTAADRTRSVIRVDLRRVLAHDPADDVLLEPLDVLGVLSKWDVEERGQVSIDGLVRHPGRYEYLEGMTLADLVFEAGGLTDDALALAAELARVDLDPRGAHIADTLWVPLEPTFSADSPASSFRLLRRDAVFVRRDPGHREQVFVSVEGEVRFPGRYALTRRDERIADLVRRAGGLTEFAYGPGASFARVGAPRLGIDLPAALRDPGSASNLALESSDVLRVPRFQPIVTIEGAVFNPGTALYHAGSGVGYYVTQANGFRTDADRRRVVIVQANGSVQKGGTPGPGQPRAGTRPAGHRATGPPQGRRGHPGYPRQRRDHGLPRAPGSPVSAPHAAPPAVAAVPHSGLVLDDPAAAGFDWRGTVARLWLRRRRLTAWTLAGGLAALALSFVLPPVYVASLTLMEAQSSGANSTSPQLGAVEEQIAMRLGTRTGGVATYPEIVRSRLLLTRVLERRFTTARGRSVVLLDRLTRAAPPDQRLDAGVRRLRERVDAALDRRTGLLTLRVSLDDPVVAAGVATAVSATLQDIVVRTMNSQAGANRRFIEGCLADARRAVARAEDALRAFRENNLRGSSPRMLTEEARLLRETRTQEEIMLTLTRQHEIARVEEQKNVPVISVIDPAVPPAFRNAPRRGTLTGLGLLLGLVGGAAWVMLRGNDAAAEATRERG